MAAGTFHNLVAAAPVITPDDRVSVPWDRIEQFVGQFTHDVRNGLNALELQLTFLGEISTEPETVDEVRRLRGTLLEVTRQLQAIKVATGPVTPNLLEYPTTDLLEDLRERLERLYPDDAPKVSWGNDGRSDRFVAGRSRPRDQRSARAFRQHLPLRRFVDPLHDRPRAARPGLHPPGSYRRCAGDRPERWGEPLLSGRRGAYGLGLFRVRRILETQGGELSFVFSAAENLLTTTATLPGAGQAGRANTAGMS